KRDVFDLMAEDAAGGVDVLEVRVGAPLVALADLRVHPRERLVAADDDGGVGIRGAAAATAAAATAGGERAGQQGGTRYGCYLERNSSSNHCSSFLELAPDNRAFLSRSCSRFSCRRAVS